MCDLMRQLDGVTLSRRKSVGAPRVSPGSIATAALRDGSWQHPAAQTRDLGAPDSLARDARTSRSRLILLGTAGGPPWWPGSTRSGIASAVVVGSSVYLIDCGEGVGRQYLRAGLGGQGDLQGLERLRGIFLTHLHSDHTIDYANLLILGLYNGLPDVAQPIQIYGPGNRGILPPIFGSPSVPPPVINAGNPTPGTVEMTDYLLRAYATDINDRLRDNLKPDPASLIRVHDISLPHGVGSDPNGAPAQPMEPFFVFEDENVRVSATLVYHAPVFPSFAFRFDTTDGSIVFSGDTGPCQNLVTLAQDADILVHEVIDVQWVEHLVGSLPRTVAMESLLQHMLQAHTTIEDVGKVAEAARVNTLVLSHLVPGNNAQHRWLAAQNNFSGQLVVGDDLLQIGVGQAPR